MDNLVPILVIGLLAVLAVGLMLGSRVGARRDEKARLDAQKAQSAAKKAPPQAAVPPGQEVQTGQATAEAVPADAGAAGWNDSDAAGLSEVTEMVDLTISEEPAEPGAPSQATDEGEPDRSEGWLRRRLSKARALLGDYVSDLRNRSKLDDEVWEDLEEALIRADVGVAATTRVIGELQAQSKAEGWDSPGQALDALRSRLVEELGSKDRSLHTRDGELSIWMFVGVNGVGKTTTIGKLAQRAVRADETVVLAAGDTFRAAASEQLATWGERVGAHTVRSHEGADPASVVFDAVDSAKARDASLLLVDTAGRLHTKTNLMEELKKLRRVVDRQPGALQEVLLVMDATTGQNGLAQARIFAEAVDVTGIVLTKLDGTAKGGIVLAIQEELGLPVKVVGVGERADDLIDFDPEAFVDALLGTDD